MKPSSVSHTKWIRFFCDNAERVNCSLHLRNRPNHIIQAYKDKYTLNKTSWTQVCQPYQANQPSMKVSQNKLKQITCSSSMIFSPSRTTSVSREYKNYVTTLLADIHIHAPKSWLISPEHDQLTYPANVTSVAYVVTIKTPMNLVTSLEKCGRQLEPSKTDADDERRPSVELILSC